MKTPPDNPCARCSTGQSCCSSLTNLRVTESEYERLFARRRAGLTIQRDGPIYRISAKQGRTCPHWNNGCGVYGDRPVECRLYPYTIGEVWIWHRWVLVTFHSRPTGCPNTELLLMPRGEARKLLSSFAREGFGETCRVYVTYETPIFTLVRTGIGLAFKLARRVMPKLAARLRG